MGIKYYKQHTFTYAYKVQGITLSPFHTSTLLILTTILLLAAGELNNFSGSCKKWGRGFDPI